MFPYVVSISITDSTGSDKQLFHTDLYNYMPYFSAGMPDIKILLLAVPAHILPQAVPRHTADNYILPRNLPAIPYRFLSLEHHTFHETKTITFFSRCNTFPDHFIKQIQNASFCSPDSLIPSRSCQILPGFLAVSGIR